MENNINIIDFLFRKYEQYSTGFPLDGICSRR